MAARPKSEDVGPVVAPVHISRVPVFEPTFKRPYRSENEEFRTSRGVVRVNGKLTATHRKILDAIFAEALHTEDMGEDGPMVVVVDPFSVAKTAGVSRHHPKWLRGKLDEMQSATVELTRLKNGIPGDRFWGQIISEVRESDDFRVALPGGAFVGDRALWEVTISAVWMRLYDTDLVVRYALLLPEINQLAHGATHAFALHVLSHRRHTRYIDDILRDVGALRDGMTRVAQEAVRQSIREEAAALKRLGIHLVLGGTGELRVDYSQHPQVRFKNP